MHSKFKHYNQRWKQNGTTVVGGHEKGNGLNQLNGPWGLFIDDDQTIYVADIENHRTMKWQKKCNQWSNYCRWKWSRKSK
jgi:hypothetical protein